MKRTILIVLICILAGSAGVFAQIKVASNGYVGINNSSPAYRLDVSGTARFTVSGYSIRYDGAILYPSYGSYVDLGSYGNFWYNLFAYYPVFYTEPVIMSDISIKKDINPLASAKESIRLLNPVRYKLNPVLSDNTPEDIKSRINNTLQYGFVAQEVQKIFPDLVTTQEDGLLGIQYTGLIPVLVKAIQEQQQEIDELFRRIAELEKKIQ